MMPGSMGLVWTYWRVSWQAGPPGGIVPAWAGVTGGCVHVRRVAIALRAWRSSWSSSPGRGVAIGEAAAFENRPCDGRGQSTMTGPKPDTLCFADQSVDAREPSAGRSQRPSRRGDN